MGEMFYALRRCVDLVGRVLTESCEGRVGSSSLEAFKAFMAHEDVDK